MKKTKQVTNAKIHFGFVSRAGGVLFLASQNLLILFILTGQNILLILHE